MQIEEISKSTEYPISDKNELMNNVYKMQNEPLNQIQNRPRNTGSQLYYGTATNPNTGTAHKTTKRSRQEDSLMQPVIKRPGGKEIASKTLPASSGKKKEAVGRISK